MLRFEYKYFVPNSKLDLLRSLIKPFTTLDKFAASRVEQEYTVRSIYFDTPDFECYHTKIDGQKHRNKVRLRGYNKEKSTNTVFLEIKRKYEAPILKNRAPMKYGFAKSLFQGINPELFIQNTEKFKDARDNASKFMYNVYARKMRPVVCVIYEREPYLSKTNDEGNNLRITFDKNLRGTPYPTVDELYREDRARTAIQGIFILEVKFNDYYPAWMKPIISMLGLVKESASKYCLCIDAHPSIDVDRPLQTFSYGRITGPSTKDKVAYAKMVKNNQKKKRLKKKEEKKARKAALKLEKKFNKSQDECNQK